MGWYRTGTVTVTNGSAAVTGVGGIWLSQAAAGDLFTIDGTKFYEILTVNSDTSITLQTTYTGTTQSGIAYAIVRNFTSTLSAGLAASIADLVANWNSQLEEVSATVFRGVGGGITDDTAAWNAAIVAGKPISLVAGRRYLLSSETIKVATNRDFIVYGNGATIVFNHPAATLKRFISAESQYDFVQAVSSVTAVTQYSFDPSGATDISSVGVADGSVFSVGNIVKIVADDLMEGSDVAKDMRTGEYATVGAISGNTLYLRGMLRYSYTTNVRIAKLNTSRRFLLKDIEFELGAGITLDGTFASFISVTSYYRPMVKNCSLKGWAGPFINFIGCYGHETSSNRAVDLKTDTGNDLYGYAEVTSGGAYGTSDMLFVENVRHGWTTNGLSTPANSPNIARYGRSIHMKVSNGIGVNCQSAAWDTHPDADEVDFYDCVSINPYRGVAGDCWGTQTRGLNVRHHNPVSHGVGGFLVSNGGGKGATKNAAFINPRHIAPAGLSDTYPHTFKVDGTSSEGITNVSIDGMHSYTPAGSTAPAVRFDYCDVEINNSTIKMDMVGDGQNMIQTSNATVRGRGNTLDFSGATGQNFDLIRSFSSNDRIDLEQTQVISGANGYRALIDYSDVGGVGSFKNTSWNIAPVNQNGARRNGNATHDIGYLGGFDTPYLGDKISDSYQGFSINTQMWAMTKGTNATCNYGIVQSQPRAALRLTFGNDAGGTMDANGSLKAGSLSWRPQDGAMFIESRFFTSSISNVVYFVGFTDTTDFECPFTLDGSANPVAVATDAVGILFDTNGSSTAFYGVGVKNGVVVSVNLGNPPTGSGTVRWRVSVDAGGNATFFRNGLKIGGTLANAVTPTISLAPVECGFSRNNSSKYLQLDFTTVKQGSP